MKRFFCALLVFLLLPAFSLAETIVTSFYPVWLLALNLTKGLDGVEVVNLTDSSVGCLHDYSLQNSDMTVLSRADALVINGAGMETFLPVITSAFPDLPVIDATAGLPFLSESDIVEIGGHEEGEGVNPHLWLDPQRYTGMAANVAEGLISLLPDKAEQIRGNLDECTSALVILDALYKDFIATDRKVIVFHEAFSYFAEACGLSVIATVNKEPEDALPTAQLVRVAELIKAEPKPPLILKSAEPDPSVTTLVNETGVPVCELDPITSGPEDPSPDEYYGGRMLANLFDLQLALEALK